MYIIWFQTAWLRPVITVPPSCVFLTTRSRPLGGSVPCDCIEFGARPRFSLASAAIPPRHRSAICQLGVNSVNCILASSPSSSSRHQFRAWPEPKSKQAYLSPPYKSKWERTQSQHTKSKTELHEWWQAMNTKYMFPWEKYSHKMAVKSSFKHLLINIFKRRRFFLPGGKKWRP